MAISYWPSYWFIFFINHLCLFIHLILCSWISSLIRGLKYMYYLCFIDISSSNYCCRVFFIIFVFLMSFIIFVLGLSFKGIVFPRSESSFRVIIYWLQSWPTGCHDLNKLLCLKFGLGLKLHVQSSGLQMFFFFSLLENEFIKYIWEIPIIKYLKFSLWREKNETKNFFPLDLFRLFTANSEALAPKYHSSKKENLWTIV